MDFSIVTTSLHYYPKLCNAISYGTAGFRSKENELDYILYRMGLLAVLRSKFKAAAVGIMITASHNPLPDNGVKLVDPYGEMLVPEWELFATNLASAEDNKVLEALTHIIGHCKIDLSITATVYIGRDTRPSSSRLQDAAVTGISDLGGTVIDIGEVSTPILHYVVTCHNSQRLFKYGIPTEDGYYQKLSNAFNSLMSTDSLKINYRSDILFDGANGVGAQVMSNMLKYISNSLNISVFNEEGVLNYLCGAEYVKSQQAWPSGVPKQVNVRCVSVDGDADRIIYCYLDDDGGFHMVDGDKIATLFARYLQELLHLSGLSLQLGLVQTAYANGASTEYIKNSLGIPVTFTKTGVKHLHHAAIMYDIGVYFEANGHGTIIFSSSAKEAISNAIKENKNAQKLSTLIDVINETVGDAISDMLVVECILYDKDWSIMDWDKTYIDLPNRQIKVTVADRSVITTTDAETKCLNPEGLQQEINKLIRTYAKGRSFVRPSGTENVVRVYAEAESQTAADSLAAAVALKVYELAGGVGKLPLV